MLLGFLITSWQLQTRGQDALGNCSKVTATNRHKVTRQCTEDPATVKTPHEPVATGHPCLSPKEEWPQPSFCLPNCMWVEHMGWNS